MSQSPDKNRSPRLKQYLEQKDKNEIQTLDDFDRVIKEARERVVQKTRELDFFSKLDKAQVSKHMFKEDPQILPNALRREVQEPMKRIKEKFPEKIDDDTEEALNALPERKPDIVIDKAYLDKTKENFYAPLTKERIKDLYKVLKDDRGNFSLAGLREDEKKGLAERYRKKYSAMLKDQLRQEVERKRRQDGIDEIRILELVHRNKATLNLPKIWNKKAIDPEEAANVQKIFQQKMISFQDEKLAFLKETEGGPDICRLVDIHLSTRYRDVDIEKQLDEIIKDGVEAKKEEQLIKEAMEKMKAEEEERKNKIAEADAQRKFAEEEATKRVKDREEEDRKKKVEEQKEKLLRNSSFSRHNISGSSANNYSNYK